MKKITKLLLTSMLALFTGVLQAGEDPTMQKNVIIIFDDSGSMGAGKTSLKPSKMLRAQKAAKAFISELSDEYNLGNSIYSDVSMLERFFGYLDYNFYIIGSLNSEPTITQKK